ncbi:MAG: siphovirus Gp157 family protein [Pyramidobacter sp.]|nr:siphovirus Gp157 family protein [Pyramidobacter sp.]MBQ8129302.1 siphovirus Gp157 family protein [Clostridia bacterium]MBR1896281.1 siphovirus Gp157 family protein [Pyramidobacter sp.]
MPKLYELTDEHIDIWNAIGDALDDPETDWAAAEAELKALEGAFDAKVENCAKVIRNMEAEEAAIKSEIERLQKRDSALSGKIKSFKEYVKIEMQAAGREKIKTDLFTVAIQRSPDKLIVHSEEHIPEIFFKHIPATTQLDKTAVKKALAGGAAVPGCELAHGFHLRIR